ncbi:hypothetical protein G6F37_010774 [Rhizopus arrhizus]|nr:hypothetical protein G6F38_007786 [Rhizopus arrhizus]KAG1152606.1 hypothetical protein G6F37_010774 [Rhizopus arrhizus]
MSQDNLFSSSFQSPSQQIFDPSAGLYRTDIPLQFAASVPHRQQPQPQPQPQQQYDLPLHFQSSSFQNPDVAIPPSSLNRFTNNQFDCSESLVTSGGMNKQLQSKAERRAEHNATERARRENLNAKFQQLAHTLPNLQNDSRNSKSTIIDRTLDYIKGSITKEERMQNRIKELEKINSYLLSQLDERSSKRRKSTTHIETSSPSSPLSSRSSAASEESNHRMEDINKVEPKKSTQGHLITEAAAASRVLHNYPSVSPSSTTTTTTTPITTYYANSRYQQQPTKKQEPVLYYDLCSSMTHPMMKYQESTTPVASLQSQQQYIHMPPQTLMDQHHVNQNEQLFHLIQRQ